MGLTRPRKQNSDFGAKFEEVSVESITEMGKESCLNFLQPLLANFGRRSRNDDYSNIFKSLIAKADPPRR